MTILLTPRNNVQPHLDPTSAANLAAFFEQVIVDIREQMAALAGIHAQLDADATVGDTDYASSNDPAAQTALEALLSFQRGLGGSGMKDTDYHAFTAAVLADLTAIRGAIVATTAKLDADSGVTDTNYASTLNPAALTVTADTFSDFETRNPVASFAAPSDYASIRTFSGECEADVAALRAAIVGITAKLDADGGVTDTDYAANNDPAAAVTTVLTAS
jgi:hypothetical protein